MSAQNTRNTQAFIEAEQYSNFILENMHDGLLPDTFTRNVSDFGNGTTLNIKTVGTRTLQEVFESQPMEYTAIDTDTVTLQITDYVGDAWAVTDVLRQDGNQVEALHSMQAVEATRALQEYVETRFLATANGAQTDGNPNTINGFAHRVASAETNNVISLDHFFDMKLAFNKAGAPGAGRIAIIDAVCERTLEGLFTTTSSVNFNPQFEGIVNEGFTRDHRFVRNIAGWDIYTSDRLARGDFGDGTTSVSGAVANVFMCVGDDQAKPIMRAWRQMPKVEAGRNRQLKQDEFDLTARFGLGAQRVDTLGILITSASNY